MCHSGHNYGLFCLVFFACLGIGDYLSGRGHLSDERLVWRLTIGPIQGSVGAVVVVPFHEAINGLLWGFNAERAAHSSEPLPVFLTVLPYEDASKGAVFHFSMEPLQLALAGDGSPWPICVVCQASDVLHSAIRPFSLSQIRWHRMGTVIREYGCRLAVLDMASSNTFRAFSVCLGTRSQILKQHIA